MNKQLDLSKLTTTELNDLKLLKNQLLEDTDFIEFVEKYNKTLIKLRKPKKTLDELFEICYDKWINAKLSTDLLFGLYFDDLQVSERLVNIFLKSKNVKIGAIKKIIRQQTIDLGFDIRGIRFDVLIEGSDKIVNIEIQTGKKSDLPLRIRYYQALLDMHLLPKGGNDTYKLLPETYIIFICSDKDPVGEGELEYLINPYAYNKSENKYTLFNTKSNWIVYNASGYKNYDEKNEFYNEELKTFFAYLKNDPIDNTFTDYLHQHFIKTKENKEMGRNFMLALVRDMEKYEEGSEDRAFKMVVNLIKKNCDVDFIQDVTELSIEEINEIRKEYFSFNP